MGYAVLVSQMLLKGIYLPSMRTKGRKERVCVTGAGGYIASWLVKLLLSNDYIVHGTVRGPNDEKNSHLKKLEKAQENLKVFKADLLDYNSIASAVAGCEGVFHVAGPFPSRKVSNPEVELYNPAVTGTLNVLEACSEAKVKRVVVVSSVAAVMMNPNWPKDKVRDEDCWSDKDYCKTTEEWYCLSKTLAEGEAVDFGKKHGLDVITVCPSLVIGPLLQSTLNFSSLLLIHLFKGNESVTCRTWNCVDVRDLSDALLLMYEKPEASGRYICAPYSNSLHDLVDILKRNYPNYVYATEYIEAEGRSIMSAEKLKKLGWKYRTLEESVIDSVTYYQEAGLVNKN